MSSTSHPMDAGALLGSGILSRVTFAVYRHLALALWLALCCAPAVVGMTLLGGHASNVLLLVWLQLPVAPALAAGLFSVRVWRKDGDTSPFALFLRGLRRNTLDVLRWWVPTLAVASVLAVNVVNADAVPGGSALRIWSLGLGLLLVLWSGHALLLSSHFSFRTRDTARIALYLVAAEWRTTVAFVSLLIVAAGVTYLASEAVLVLFAWAFISVLELISRPALAHIEERFTVRDN